MEYKQELWDEAEKIATEGKMEGGTTEYEQQLQHLSQNGLDAIFLHKWR